MPRTTRAEPFAPMPSICRRRRPGTARDPRSRDERPHDHRVVELVDENLFSSSCATAPSAPRTARGIAGRSRRTSTPRPARRHDDGDRDLGEAGLWPTRRSRAVGSADATECPISAEVRRREDRANQFLAVPPSSRGKPKKPPHGREQRQDDERHASSASGDSCRWSWAVVIRAAVAEEGQEVEPQHVERGEAALTGPDEPEPSSARHVDAAYAESRISSLEKKPENGGMPPRSRASRPGTSRCVIGSHLRRPPILSACPARGACRGSRRPSRGRAAP